MVQPKQKTTTLGAELVKINNVMEVLLRTTFQAISLKNLVLYLINQVFLKWLIDLCLAACQGVVHSTEILLAIPSAKFYSNKDEFFQ